jgi:hypothetical protein
MNTVPSVQPLQKIGLRLKAGATAEDLPTALPHIDLTFIFGIGTAGLTPFECLLHHRLPGDEIEFRVAGSEAGPFFGHVAPFVAPLCADRYEVHFNARILAIETPAPREIIKAMAEMTSHGHGSGCDCGCGCG